jgi:hypothetical protein
MADQCGMSRCHNPHCRMPLPNRYYHAVLTGAVDLRFCSSGCLRNWRRDRTRAGSALKAALSIEASRYRVPEAAHPQATALDRIATNGLAQSFATS